MHLSMDGITYHKDICFYLKIVVNEKYFLNKQSFMSGICESHPKRLAEQACMNRQEAAGCFAERNREEVMGLLREIVEKKLTKYAASAPDWREAVRMSCERLEAEGIVEANYKEDIISCLEKYGPYIVIAPMIAMPHSQENAQGVHKTEIGFMKLAEAVSFDEEDPEKDATVFFTVASCDPNQHIDNISRLSELLSDDAVLDALVKVESDADLLQMDAMLEI